MWCTTDTTGALGVEGEEKKERRSVPWVRCSTPVVSPPCREVEVEEGADLPALSPHPGQVLVCGFKAGPGLGGGIMYLGSTLGPSQAV